MILEKKDDIIKTLIIHAYYFVIEIYNQKYRT